MTSASGLPGHLVSPRDPVTLRLFRKNSHNIKLTLLKCTIQFSGIWYTHSVVQPSPLSSSRTFPPPKGLHMEGLYLLNSHSPSSPQPLATTHVLSVSVALSVLETVGKRTRRTRSPSYPTSLTERDGFKVHAHCSLCQVSLLPMAGEYSTAAWIELCSSCDQMMNIWAASTFGFLSGLAAQSLAGLV